MKSATQKKTAVITLSMRAAAEALEQKKNYSKC